ncbi:guanine nucleotide exchange factor in Golgi transport N-terminal-domain-containing protein [Sphaerosporella brunnea]|uniref:Guanine nucleotide exchange factor in Golgi transport N-terminal-domain-containing protein n=1 Tax=Sphaerosporella brunnea TaxID=1250544 RepID=A0A5J5F168_9PEZI|nr:guanine nucleotide exchange factor in Golgi transport N-terminal-domain-containing protein [Sphaerosporella brunnea]
MGVVNNTAAATLSQIVISIFDKVVTEDEKALHVPANGEAPSESGNIPVRPAALDAYRVFNDLCLLTEGHRPAFLRFTNLPQPFGLEIIESVLTNHPDIFLSHPEQAHILRTRVAPLVIRSLSERLNFPTTVRITRVLYILLRRHLSILTAECEVSLGLLTHMLEPDSSQPWKRALCMEVFRGICSEPALIRKIFSQYDAKEGGKPIVKELISAMTRLAHEKPSVIGLGTQSSAPAGQQLAKDASSEQVAMEAGGVAGIIGGAVGLGETVAGLSSQWSLVRVPCIDQLDKSEPPAMPESYIYCLALTCFNSFSEGLARFVLPLAASDSSKRRTRPLSMSVSGRGGSDVDSGASSSGRPGTPDGRTPSPAKQSVKRKSTVRQPRVPTNPLSLESHLAYQEIVTSSLLVDACWPALLAAYSTFLYASLDNELYHGLVRSFQKLSQVAGVLRLTTPRDAFLTTLGKAAVPPNVLSANISTPATPISSTAETLFSNAKGLLGVDGIPGSTSTGSNTADHAPPSLNSRNLLCLRALLNLGIALGPTLEASWTIVLETLQQADYVLFASSRRSGRQLSLSGTSGKADGGKPGDSSNLMTNIGTELAAVEAASAKMFEGTRDFPDEAFVSILSALCKLLDIDEDKANRRVSVDKPRHSSSPHRRLPSISGYSNASQIIGDNAFTLAKIGELAQINMFRLIGSNPDVSGWNILINHLAQVSKSRDMGNSIRFKAAEVLNEIVVSAAKSVTTESTENVKDVQERILTALKDGVEYSHQFGQTDSATKTTELEIHRAGLEALNAILEHAGQSLISGWEVVFDIITSVFDPSMVWRRDSTMPSIVEPPAETTMKSKNLRLIKSSFSSLELICSDFLSSLPTSCILVLIDALFAFCSQKDDLNISLTTVTFFWNVSDFLQSRGDDASEGEKLTAKAEKEKDLLDIVERTNVDSHSALWMLLLLRLTGVSRDYRAEVRNGSIQTLFRIFDTYGHQLGPSGWTPCLKIVVFKMMNINPKELAMESDSESDRKNWDETIKLILSGIGTLYSNYFEVFAQQEDFSHTWTVFVRYLEDLLTRKSFGVSTAVFQVVSRVLARVGHPENLTVESRQEIWRLWSSQGVKLVEGIDKSGNGVQETLGAYVQSYQALYRLIEPTLTADTVRPMLEILRECILFPDAPPYFQDIDMITPLQASILEVIRLTRTDIEGVPSLLLKQLAEFSTIAFSQSRVAISGKGSRVPSCIALSMQSISQLEAIAIKHIEDPEIYVSSALAVVLAALEVPIGLKYDFAPASVPKGKCPNLWIHPTRAALAIIKAALPAMDRLDVPDDTKREIWETIVKVVSSVLKADNNSHVDEAALRKDETLDIEAFREVRKLIIPKLGGTVVPEQTALSYVEAVFWSSMLHRLTGVPTEAEEWLTARNQGSTSELVTERRHRMGYVCIDELFDLTAVGAGDGPKLKRLAEIAAPWLIRRVGLVLGRYVSDQPLRGRMPQPASQRKELLYILDRVVRLESGLDTVHIDSPHIPPSSKRHLFRLFPLFTKCVAVAQGDSELLGLLSSALGEIGKSLKLDSAL